MPTAELKKRTKKKPNGKKDLSAEMRIEYMPIAQLKKWPTNPKNHDVEAIEASIREFDFIDPLIIDEKSKKMVAGHGRLEVVAEMKRKGEPPPKGINAHSGDWWLPVLRGKSFKSEAQAEAYLLANNRLVETGGWNADLLRPALLRLKESEFMPAAGWTPKEIERELKPPVDLSKTPGGKMTSFMASDIKQIVVMLPASQYEETLQRIQKVMEKKGLKSHTEVVLHLLDFYESRNR